MLKKINPQTIIRHQKLPRFTDRSEPGGFPGAQNSENLHENVDGDRVEVAGGGGVDVHHLEEAVELRLLFGVGVGFAGGGRRGARKLGDGTPKVPNESAHGCITTGTGTIDLNAID